MQIAITIQVAVETKRAISDLVSSANELMGTIAPVFTEGGRVVDSAIVVSRWDSKQLLWIREYTQHGKAENHETTNGNS